MSEGLYFVGVVLPGNIQKEITELKQLVAEKFGSKHALNSPAHITLHMPFKWKDKKIDLLHETIQNINSDVTPFEIELKDFDFFKPRVVFVDVVENENLNQLQKLVVDQCRQELKLDKANYKDQAFHPHVTIAYRDLKKKMFYTARRHFESQILSFKFQVEKVELFKHDGKKWGIEVID